jgi:protein SCO1
MAMQAERNRSARRRCAGWLFLAALAVALMPVVCGAPAPPPAPVLTKKLGADIPLDLTLTDETGKDVTLRPFFDKPVVLLLVYLRCPGVCSPLMHAVAKTVDLCDLVPGTDYRIVTISFDEREHEKLDVVRAAKAEMLRRLEKKIPPESWQFLTGKAPAIAAICDAVGFQVVKRNEDFDHPLTITFLSPRGKITRYLSPSQSIDEFKILPADFKMAVIDASEGRVGTFMDRIERFCYGYDTDKETYIFKVDRIVLAVTLLFVMIFGLYLLVRRAPRPATGAAKTPPTQEHP